MPAGKHKLIIEKGATLNPVFTWETENADGSTTPVNITGYSARAQVRPDVASSTVVVDMTDGNGKLILGGATGKVTLNVPASETTDIAIEEGVWDLELVSPGGVVTRLLEGPVKVKPEVTRP